MWKARKEEKDWVREGRQKKEEQEQEVEEKEEEKEEVVLKGSSCITNVCQVNFWRREYKRERAAPCASEGSNGIYS